MMGLGNGECENDRMRKRGRSEGTVWQAENEASLSLVLMLM